MRTRSPGRWTESATTSCTTVRGQVIGTVKRIPPKRPFRHTWRIEQPGHPEITGRNEWVSGSLKHVAGRAAAWRRRPAP
ncbi:hypothetical protein [Microbispora sp. NPDC046933]|uniref:hypothetical protein n=1 Tax=Microbispora sp. NPDC046933 TaxID=3155618 RepID=UPI003401AA3F